MLNWIAWNGTVFGIETLLTLNRIVLNLTVYRQNMNLYLSEVFD